MRINARELPDLRRRRCAGETSRRARFAGVCRGRFAPLRSPTRSSSECFRSSDGTRVRSTASRSRMPRSAPANAGTWPETGAETSEASIDKGGSAPGFPATLPDREPRDHRLSSSHGASGPDRARVVRMRLDCSYVKPSRSLASFVRVNSRPRTRTLSTPSPLGTDATPSIAASRQ